MGQASIQVRSLATAIAFFNSVGVLYGHKMLLLVTNREEKRENRSVVDRLNKYL